MPTYIRLTDYKDSSSKEQGFFEAKNRYTAKQEDFSKIPGSPIAYWVSDKVKEIFANPLLLDKGNFGEGLSTKNNDLFIREWFEVNFNDIKFNTKNPNETYSHKYYPFHKGGEVRKWYGNNDFIVNFKNDGEDLKNYKKSQLKNYQHYFKKGLTWSKISSSFFSVRFSNIGSIYGDAGLLGIIKKEEDLFYIIGFLNSKLVYKFLNIINPTLNYIAGSIEKLPLIIKHKQKIDTLTQECINISKEDWGSRETSWDFKVNPLVAISKKQKAQNSNPTLEEIYNEYCNYWEEKFYKLHQNEEELNRLFIEIYGLEDELSPDVALEDITILKKETKIIDNKLIFQKDEIIKQLISYSVGVIVGRYSLDEEGLFIANLNESKTHHLMDDDNIIPILQFDYFKDDIVTQFRNFLKVAFGEENLDKNIQFIESALNKSLRNYFLKDFYEDHIKRYKKRPIYWMVSSPKKGFFAIFYLHRYYPDIFARIQNSYLREFINKLQAQKESFHQLQIEAPSTKEKNRAIKELKTINTLEKELIEFDRNIFTKYAQTQTDIDLDDGVKENHCKFKDILYPIKGLCK